MKRNTKARISSDGPRGFFERARARARKLDRGEDLMPEVTISFEDPGDMMRVLSTERIRLLRAARGRGIAVSELAAGLRRDTRAVSRDIELLEEFGLLRTRYEDNPGHGRRRMVVPRAAKYQLTVTI